MSGSIQQVRYLAARAAGATMMTACAETGIAVSEARLIENDIAKGLLRLPDPVPPHPLNHNQPEEPVMAEGNVAADELRLLIERVERMEEEKKAISDDIKDVYAEAKSRGYDTKTMREMVKLRKMEPQARRERDAMIETYRAALGMDFVETPLGQAAVARAAGDGLVDLARKITANGGTVVNGSLVMPLSEKARDAAGVPSEDDLYPKACGVVATSGKASVSYLQRQLGIGYNCAARLMERMEREGIVSAPDHIGKRSVTASGAMRAALEKTVDAVNAGALGPGVTATFHPGH